MTDEKIRQVVDAFAAELKMIYGSKLAGIILYGSCARGDYGRDSDIDILVLLYVTPEQIGVERLKSYPISDRLDWDYDVVLTPVFQSYDTFQRYLAVSCFYQNVDKEGIRIA